MPWQDMVDVDALALALYEIEAVKFGRFTLHSGKQSPIYVDLRVLVSYPEVLRLMAQAYTAVLQTLTFDILGAYPYAGLPIGVAVSLEMNRPLIYPRKQAKSYGTGKQVEGVWQVGDTAVVLEDLITSGKSIIEASAALKAAGLQVHEAVVLVDRQQGGIAELTQHGITVHPIMTLSDLLFSLEKQNRLPRAQRLSILKQLDIPSL
jgi:orotate phosphoribosyltransferase